ncbi:MAG: helix-turn-helix domain-containing protein [Betaproteobacteria bacterium]|nr:helix-turn-helix domain-containing protein [Betaproteobacteria bacterium]
MALLSIHHQRYRALQTELTQLRKHAGLSQVQLADRLGVGQPFISKIERGDAYVDLLFFADWCRACGACAGTVLEELIGDAECSTLNVGRHR